MKVFTGELYCFRHYCLTVIDTTEEKVRKALIKRYRTEYEKLNGHKPSNKWISEEVKDFIEIHEFNLGEVELR